MNAKKRMHYLVMIAMISSLMFTACKKQKKEAEETFTPLPTPVGNVYGQATTATIGAQGGTVATSDGKIQITVPSGALSANTTISIQPVENTNPGSFGLNYRLLPHGATFSKPVNIRFSYAGYLDSIPMPEALAIAFQDADHVWKIPKGYVLDKTNKTINIQTTHFSDWSVMRFLMLKPEYAILKTSGQLTLQAYTCVKLDDQMQPDWGDDLIPPYVPVADKKPLPEKFIKAWELAGGGKLEPKGNSALYTAPATVPDRNPVVVSVRLNTDAATLLLISNIRIAPEGVWIQFDQDEALGYRDYIMNPNPGDFGLEWRASRNGDWQGVLSGPINGVGSYSWTQDIQFWYEEPLRFGDHTITSFFEEGTTAVPSSGYIKITQWGRVGEAIIGEFLINKAGRYNANSGGGELISTHVIKGHFNVIRE